VIAETRYDRQISQYTSFEVLWIILGWVLAPFISHVLLQYIDAVEWLKVVILSVSGSRPTVVRQQTSATHAWYAISFNIEEGAIMDPNRGESVCIHVQSNPFPQDFVSARQAVRKALKEVEQYTRHRFPDYNYLKVKALEVNELDVRQMPKTLSLAHESWNVWYLNTY
jgi:hypothetical protein